MYQCSRPGSQQVDNAWNSTLMIIGFMMLAQQGYIVAYCGWKRNRFQRAAFKNVPKRIRKI